MIYAFGEFELDEDRWALTASGKIVDVPPKVMETLVVLLRHRHRVVSSDELRAMLWPGVTVTDASVRKSIRIARRILGGDEGTESHIGTTRGRGYRFVSVVREVHPAAERPPTVPPGPRTLLPPPSIPPSTDDEPFVGRDAELEELGAALDRSLEGRGTFLLLSGEPGIGKTRLAERFAERARERGMRVAWGRCCEEGGAPELWPWIQILRALLSMPGLFEETGPVLSEVSRILPERRRHDDPQPSWLAFPEESARFRLFDAIAVFFRRAAATAPLVVILEDLHTADATSLILARFLVRELRDAGVLVLGTHRPLHGSDAATAAAAFAKLSREGRRMTLSGLSPAETHALVDAAFEGPAAPALVREVQRATEGNPLFVTEVLRLLTSAKVRPRAEEGRLVLDAVGVPDRVLGAIRERLDSVPDATRALLSVAAVVGRDFDLALLGVTAEQDRKEVARTLEPAIEQRLVIEHSSRRGHFRFAHILFRDVLYDGLGIARRAELHQRAGEALERSTLSGAEPAAAVLAHHFSRAALGGGSEKASVHSLAAGRQALRSMAFDEAARHFENALESLGFSGQQHAMQADILLELGHARRLVGSYAPASDTFKKSLSAARAGSDPVRAARAALGFARVRPESGMAVNEAVLTMLAGAIADLDAADRRVHPDADEHLTLLLARRATCAIFAGRREEGEAHSLRALELARALGRPDPLAHALLARHWVLWMPGTAEERLAIASEVVALDAVVDDGQLLLEARQCQITDLLELGRLAALDRALLDYTRLAQTYREPLTLRNVPVYEAMKALLSGRLEQAESAALDALQAGLKVHEDNSRMLYGAQLSWLRTEQGRALEMEAPFREHAASQISVRASLLRLYTEARAEDAAREQLELVARGDFADLARDWSLLPTLAHVASACAFLGDARRAERVYERLAPHAGTHVVLGPAVVYLGPVSFYVAECARAMNRHGEAITWLERAMEESAALGARPMVARAECTLSETLSARAAPGDPARAGVLAARARATSEELGLAALAERARLLEARLLAAQA